MVLAELGKKINSALAKLNKAQQVDEELLKLVLEEICVALIQSDVNVKYVVKMRENIKFQFKAQQDEATNLRKLIQSQVVKELTSLLDAQKKPFQPKRGKSNVIMFVGLQGSGKTTTCTKYAYFWQKRGWRVALVCADTFRAGAFDQLKQNATKVRVPFYGSYSETDPVAIAEEGVSQFKKEGYEIIIVDTSGRHKQEVELFDEMKQVSSAVNPDEIIFVMDSSIGQACFDQAQAFRQAVNVGSVIITKLDGHAKGGGALSAVAATESPIIFIGLGEHFDDFEEFDPQSFIQRLLGLGDIKKLFETVKNVVNIENSGEMIEGIQSGQFTFRMFRSQFQSILKLGSINSFMSMIPGIGANLMDKNNEKENIKKLQKSICILDSMTDDELDSRGSGANILEVNLMLEQHKSLAKVVGKLGKGVLGKGNDMTQIKRNPKQVMEQMGKAFDPKMLAQMGGMGNMMDMMKQMGGMGNIQEMMKSMGMGGLGGLGGLGGGGDMMKMMKKPGKR